MIEASHLRIGNYYQDKDGNVLTVFGIMTDEYHGFVVWYALDEGFYTVQKDVNGIPLTPEWLQRLGGIEYVYDEKDKESFTKRFTIADHHFEMTEGGWMQDFGSGVDGQPMNYLHELQNRIFALTGKEITVKG